MLHIISRHRYPLALSILLTCASFSICYQRVDECGGGAGLYSGHKDIDNDRTWIRTHVYLKGERELLTSPTTGRTLILVDVVVVAVSCTQLEAINFRPDKGGKDEEETDRNREGKSEKEVSV